MKSVKLATISDIQQWMENAGYVITKGEWDWTLENEAFKYFGYNTYHQFFVGYFDDDTETYGATMILVKLGMTGFIEAEFSGVVSFETEDEQEFLTYFNSRCN